MSQRYLFGPVTAEFASEYLAAAREAGRCLAFGSEAGLDLQVGTQDRWEDVLGRLPAGWMADFVVLYLQYSAIPAGLLAAPVPLVGLAGDANWLWHGYCRIAPRLDLVFADAVSVEKLQQAGIAHARPAILFGGGRSLMEEAWPDGARDIDVLFVGNTHPAVQRERLPYLGRLARLHPRWNVVIRSGVFGAEYRKLLGRARIVFNRAARAECNMRVSEAVAAGALLFQEADNREVPALLRDREECIVYRDDDLEALLKQYLADEPARARITAGARAKLAALSFAQHWSDVRAAIAAEWPALCDRAARRTVGEPDWRGDVWQAISATTGPEPGLRAGLTAAVAQRPRDAGLLNALGVAILAAAPGRQEAAIQAAHAFQDAWCADPRHVVAGVNLAETLRMLGRREAAVEQAGRVLAVLNGAFASNPKSESRNPKQTQISKHQISNHDGSSSGASTFGISDFGFVSDFEIRISDFRAAASDLVSAPLRPFGFDLLRVEWERAAWDNASDRDSEVRAKTDLLRWWLHTLLGELTGDLLHFFTACLLRPDLPATRAALGLALARHGRFGEAVPHLEMALAGNPFDGVSARVLHDVLGRAGRAGRRLALARERRRLAEVAVGLVQPEARYEEAVPVVPATASAPVRIVWQGAQDAVHSLALVNRSLCAALLARGYELALVPASGTQPPGGRVALPAGLAKCVGKTLAGPADVHVMHQWPPDFTPPASGRWVVMQPWEFGSIPRAWLAPLRDRVDEVWVPSAFVRNVFVQDGVPAAKVHVVPLGVSEAFCGEPPGLPRRCGPAGASPAARLATRKRFTFLFVGGTTHRKGFDLLLKAYRQVFCDADDVCLVVKDMGVGTFYQGQTAQTQIDAVRKLPRAPAIEYIADELSDAAMAELYRACDVVVQPYRGEGFCLPAAEAMATGGAVIVTGFGPVLDYATDETAYLLPYRVEPFREKRVDRMETVNTPYLVEPDLDTLRIALRHVYEHPEEARERGARAREYVRQRLTWDHAAAVVETRVAALVADAASVGNRALPTLAASATELRYRLDGCISGRPRVSLTMIVKNEADNLPACLGSVVAVVDEIIVVDTGSTDDTVAIAERFGAKVVHFPWIDDFAAARNEALRHATGEWVFWMDADDRLDDANRAKLERLLHELPRENVAFVIKCLCVPRHEGDAATVVDHVRLFRNLPGLAWEHRIHEQILPGLRRRGATTRWADVVVQHVGYQDPALRQRKLERDLRILHLEYAQQPDHAYTLFNMGMTYRELGKPAEAAEFYRRSLRNSVVTDSIVRKLYASIADCERQLDRPQEALRICREGRAHYPEDAELLWQESVTLDVLGDQAGATVCLERILDARDGDHFASVTTGLRGYATRHNLAVHYLRAGRLDDAEAQWRQALAEQPRYLPALYGIADVCVARRDAAGLEAAIAELPPNDETALEAEVLRARLRQACGEMDGARRRLEELILQEPKRLSPRVALCGLLLHEGRDWSAAEAALRGALALDPHHPTCRKNLETLLRQQGRTPH